MLRSYRGIILAAFAGLILAASPPKDGTTTEQRTAEQSIAASLRSIDARLDKADKRPDPNQPCPQDRDDHASDLCAQWKAADAAYESAVWTRRGFFLGIAGFVIGLLTLIAAGFAAFFAWGAADQARRSNVLNMRENARASRRSVAAASETATALENARAGNEIARDTAKRQLRAYVGFVDIRAVDFRVGGEAKFEANLRNSGTTPAFNLRSVIVPIPILDGTNPHIAKARFKKLKEPPSRTTLHPGQTSSIVVKAGFKINADELKELMGGSVVFVLAGIMSYQDIFGHLHRATMKCYLNAAAFDVNGNALLTVCARSNNSN